MSIHNNNPYHLHSEFNVAILNAYHIKPMLSLSPQRTEPHYIEPLNWSGKTCSEKSDRHHEYYYQQQ